MRKLPSDQSTLLCTMGPAIERGEADARRLVGLRRGEDDAPDELAAVKLVLSRAKSALPGWTRLC